MNPTDDMGVPLFGGRDERVVCFHCAAPLTEDPAASKPGEIHYHDCPCGQTGLRRLNDRYQELHRKKSNVAPHDKSPYRGGKP